MRRGAPVTPARWAEGVPRPSQRPLSMRWLIGGTYGLVLVMVPLTAMLISLWSMFAIGIVVTFFLSPFVLVGLMILATLERANAVASEEDEALLEDPADLSQCLVEMTVHQNGLLTGTDRGVAWFERGCLLFSGYRTSFILGGEDSLPRRRWTLPRPFGPVEEHTVRLRHECRAVRLTLTPLRRRSDPLRHSPLLFERNLREIKAHRHKSAIARQYPPLALDPAIQIPERRELSPLAGAVGVAALGLLAVPVAALGRGIPLGLLQWSAFALSVAGFLYIALPPPNERRRALLRLRSEEPNPPERRASLGGVQ